MPKRTDIHSVLIIGAGPIIIGQACEFDYSGTQACKALKEEGFRVVLVNSNPATIMTDPEFADRTYIEPITPECVEKIIVRELDEMKKMGVPVRSSGVACKIQGSRRCPQTRFAADARRPDRAQHGHGPAPQRRAGEIRRRNDRRQRPGHRTRRRPAGVQRPHAFHRPRRAHQRHRAQPGGSPRRDGKDWPVSRHHPARVHARRHRRRHRLQPRRIRRARQARHGAFARLGNPHRRIAARLEGIRNGSHARQGRQLRHHLLHRKLRSRWASTPAIPSPSRPSRRSPTRNFRSCATRALP